MASSSAASNLLLGQPIAEKLTKSNHALWKAQVRAAVRGARLQGYLTGASQPPAAELVTKGADDKEIRVPNPALEDWEATDQQVLSYLLNSLSKDILSQVATCATAAEAWKIIEDMFASQTRARTVNTWIALATTQKGSSSVAEYFGKMKALGDEMKAAGRPLEDEELIEYIITGLGEDFNPLVTSLCTRVESITLGEFYSQLLSFETHMDLVYGGNQGGSANAASRGRGRGKISAAVASLVEATCSKEAEETMEFAAAMVVVEALEDAKGVVVSTTPTATTTIVKGLHPMKSPCVRYASKEDILLLNVGTGSMKIMCQIRDWWLRPQTLMGWTQIGT